MSEIADDMVMRADEVLALRPDALLLRRTHSGTYRTGGGAYERPFIHLMIFGPDGLETRGEFFDADRAAEALARFDELTARPAAPRPVERRVRANAATARAARLDAAIAARDADALSAVFAPGGDTLEHTTGSTSDGGGAIRLYRYLLRAEEPACRHEPLATLGDSLALFRQSTSARGVAGGTFDVGAYYQGILSRLEAASRGRWLAATVTDQHHG